MENLKTAFDMFPNLETDRYLLREVEESDCNEIYDIYCDEEAVRYQHQGSDSRKRSCATIMLEVTSLT